MWQSLLDFNRIPGEKISCLEYTEIQQLFDAYAVDTEDNFENVSCDLVITPERKPCFSNPPTANDENDNSILCLKIQR